MQKQGTSPETKRKDKSKERVWSFNLPIHQILFVFPISNPCFDTAEKRRKVFYASFNIREKYGLEPSMVLALVGVKLTGQGWPVMEFRRRESNYFSEY